jgi:hypothetical protein
MLLDMRLPDMDGLAVLNALQRGEATRGYLQAQGRRSHKDANNIFSNLVLAVPQEQVCADSAAAQALGESNGEQRVAETGPPRRDRMRHVPLRAQYCCAGSVSWEGQALYVRRDRLGADWLVGNESLGHQQLVGCDAVPRGSWLCMLRPALE